MTQVDRPCARRCTRRGNHVTGCPHPVEDHHPDPADCPAVCQPATRRDCPGCQPTPADYGDLCRDCHRRLALMLTDLPAVMDWLDVHLARGSTRRPLEDYKKPKKADAPPSPVDEDVIDLEVTIAVTLAGWVGALVERTSLTGPKLRAVSRWDVTGDVKVSAGYLLTHLTAVENQPFVAELWDELAWLTSDAHALAPWRPAARRLDGVPCPECSATALVIFGGESHVTCAVCRATIREEAYGLWVRIVADETTEAMA